MSIKSRSEEGECTAQTQDRTGQAGLRVAEKTLPTMHDQYCWVFLFPPPPPWCCLALFTDSNVKMLVFCSPWMFYINFDLLKGWIKILFNSEIWIVFGSLLNFVLSAHLPHPIPSLGRRLPVKKSNPFPSQSFDVCIWTFPLNGNEVSSLEEDLRQLAICKWSSWLTEDRVHDAEGRHRPQMAAQGLYACLCCG